MGPRNILYMELSRLMQRINAQSELGLSVRDEA